MSFIFRPMTEADAAAIVTWRYEEPYSLYDFTPDDFAPLLDPDNQYHAILSDDGALIGFCCFGRDARVPGGDYRDVEALDVGIGLRPDLTGRGLGPVVFAAILDFGRERFGPGPFRLAVATFNLRAIRVY